MAIEDEAGNIQRGDHDIGITAERYFHQLFQSTRIESEEYTWVFAEFSSRVIEDMNSELTKQVTEEEIRQAVFDISSSRA